MHELELEPVQRTGVPHPWGLGALALAFHGLADGVTLHDSEGNLLYASPSAGRELGLAVLSLMGSGYGAPSAGLIDSCGRALRPEDLPFRQVFGSYRKRELQVGLRGDEGEGLRWFRATSFFSSVPGALEAAVTLWAEVTSEVCGAEGENERRSLAAHELRTPLTTLQLSLQSLGERLKAGSVMDRQAARVKLAGALRQCGRLSQLIDRWLDPARPLQFHDPGQTEVLDLSEVVRDITLHHTEELLRAGCDLRLTLSPVRMRLDRARIEELVDNLLSNACKYGRGTLVEVRVEGDETLARITVRDEGPGIPKDEQERIFDRFGRGAAASSFPGVGLGLYVVRQVAQAHGGSVEVHSQAGSGTKFVVQLPLQQMP